MTIEFIDQDISTADGWSNFLLHLRTCMHAQASEGEIGYADVTLVITADPETGKALPSPGLACLGTVFNGATPAEVEASKDHFAFLARAFAVAGLAIGSVFVAEAWASLYKSDQDGKMPERIIAPSADPNRKEIVYIVAVHRDFGTTSFMATIGATTPTGRTIEPWVEQRGGEAEGRFGSFVPPMDLSKTPVMVETARAIIRSGTGFIPFKPELAKARASA